MGCGSRLLREGLQIVGNVRLEGILFHIVELGKEGHFGLAISEPDAENFVNILVVLYVLCDRLLVRLSVPRVDAP